jgi:cobyrinic acid a,c-diamide synthase
MHNRAWQVLGCLPSDRRVEVKERLLGLLPPSSGEGCEASAEARAKQAARLAALQKLLEEHLDIDALRAVAARAARARAARARAAQDDECAAASSAVASSDCAAAGAHRGGTRRGLLLRVP